MKFIGSKCQFCENIIEKSDDIVICSRCKTPHHRDCWKANHGCTTYSCYGDMLTPQDFEEPEFYQKIPDNISNEDMEISKADGSQFADFFGGNNDSDGIFQGVRLNSNNKSTASANNSDQKLSELFPKKTEDEIKDELRSKIKDEIKAELEDEIKAKRVTSLICERCGATLPISRKRGKIVCPSCLTEYIFNNDSSKRILKEINYENPFFCKLVDPEFSEIKDIIDTGKDYNYAYKKLVNMRKTSLMKTGYWILRLRAYTEDFTIVNTDCYYYNEIFDCLKEHIKLFPLEEEEKDFIDEYFDLNNYALNVKLKELQAYCSYLEKSASKLKNDERVLNENINKIETFVDNPGAISKLLEKKHANLYLWSLICLVCVTVLGILGVLFLITIILFPLAILCLILAIACSIGLFVTYKMKKKLEEEFRTNITLDLNRFESQRSQIRKDLYDKKLNLDRKRFECKRISEILSFKIGDLYK